MHNVASSSCSQSSFPCRCSSWKGKKYCKRQELGGDQFGNEASCQINTASGIPFKGYP